MSIGHEKATTLDFCLMCLTEPSGSAGKTIPLTTSELDNEEPIIFTTLTESTLKALGLLGLMIILTASMIRRDIVDSKPNCLDETTGLITFINSFSSVNEVTSLTTRSPSLSITNLFAKLYPCVISDTARPKCNNFSAMFKSSPATIITKLVLSPNSNSCCLEAPIKILTAGCTTSNSLIIVAASLVTKVFPILLTMILFLPAGPIDVCTIEAISRIASMFLTTAPSALECDW